MADRCRPRPVRPTKKTLLVNTRQSSITSIPEMGRKTTQKEKEKDGKVKRGPNKERWLLTRKTWRYMTDAGRRLIPDSSQNRAEDLQKIEAHFQNVCASEPRFLLWRRKASYPGALKLRRKKHLKPLPSLKQHPVCSASADEADDDIQDSADTRQLLAVITLLEKYLTLSEGTDSEAMQAQGEALKNRLKESEMISPKLFGQAERTSATKLFETLTAQQETTGKPISDPISQSDISQKTDRLKSTLMDILRQQSRYSHVPLSSNDELTQKMLKNKQALRQIYADLKQQQLDRILRRSYPSATLLSRPADLNLSGINLQPYYPKQTESIGRDSSGPSTRTSDRLSVESSGSTYIHPIWVPKISIKGESMEQTSRTFGTQTDAIPIAQIYEMHENFNRIKEKENQEKLSQASAPKLDSLSRRKSSIDNEDVSQSVSDTIKRYLRMARKKPDKDKDANRFRRVNYDENLRNIKPKGEITMPSDNDGNSKGIQTEEIWIRSVIDEIQRHPYFSQQYQRFVQRQSDASNQSKSNLSSPSSQSPPPSPSPSSGILYTSTQFLSNLLWHSHDDNKPSTTPHQYNVNRNQSTSRSGQQSDDQFSSDSLASSCATSPTSKTSPPSPLLASIMQKSKSSSNVGQVFSKKIWKSRSKSQTRTSSPAKTRWSPQGDCFWTSSNGRCIQLTSTRLQDLSDVERNSLYRVAIDRINQLNVGINVKLPKNFKNVEDVSSTPKKRTPMLLKRRALTTGFFDSSKTRDDSSGTTKGGQVFGLPLEKCVSPNLQHRHLNRLNGSDRRYRNSFNSLFDNQLPTTKIYQAESCESLPHNLHEVAHDQRSSEDEDDSSLLQGVERNLPEQIPSLVTACINYLAQNGLNVVGLFRVSTSKIRIRQLREDFDCGRITEISPDTCSHDVATLLKEYLRDLPEPLLCSGLYQHFVRTQKIRNRSLQLECISHLIKLLPLAHRDTLYALLKFFARVAQLSDDIVTKDGQTISVGNKMDSNNLATVLAPNILRSTATSKNTTGEEVQESMDAINVIRTMIDHYEMLFSVTPEIMDEVFTTMMDAYPQQLDYLCEQKECSARLENDFDSEGFSHPASPSYLQTESFLTFSTPSEQPLKPALKQRTDTGKRYVREEFTNNNSALNLHDTSSSSKISQRRRSYKHLPNVPSNSQLRFTENVPNSPTSKYHSNMSADQSVDSIQLSSSIIDIGGGAAAQRITSPYLVQGAGILRASLQIPVQLSDGQQIPLNLAADLPDIPFIEDTGFDGSSKIERSASDLSRSSADAQYRHSDTVTGSFSLRTLDKDGKGGGPAPDIPVRKFSRKIKKDHSHVEPRITTSISNIGGAVLRSKTADFERLMTGPRTKSGTTRTSVTSDVSTRSIGQTDINASQPVAPKRHGPIYKRNELISSSTQNLKR